MKHTFQTMFKDHKIPYILIFHGFDATKIYKGAEFYGGTEIT